MQSVLRKTKQASTGFTLIEVGFASIISAIMMASALLFIADYLQGQQAQALGESLFALNQAVNSYETKFSVQLANNQPVPIPGYANVANIYAPTTAELYELGLLPSQTPQGNYGIKINSTLSAGTPSGLIWLSHPFVNRAGEVDQSLAGLAMTAAGGDAGMSTAANPAQIVGADNWSAPNPVGANQPGIVAMRNGAGSGAYLRLDGSTPMQGSINMNNNNLTGANTVSTGTLTATTATTGTLTATTATATTLSATNTTTGTLTASSTNTGTLTASNTNTGTLTASSNISAGGSFSAAGNVYAGTGITTSGSLQAAGNVQASGSLQGSQVVPTGTAQAGWGCSPSGAILRDPSGNLLSCVNGVWATPNAQDIVNLSNSIAYVSNSITNVSNNLSNAINGNSSSLQGQVNNLYGSIAGLQGQISALANSSSGNQGPHGAVINVGAGPSSGAPCGGFVVYFVDGTSQVIMPSAGCSWN